MNILDFLKNNTPDNKRTGQFVHTRFSEQAGEDVTFTLRALSFDQMEEINENHLNESNVYAILDGVVEPNLRDESLLKKYKAAGYDEVVEKVFLPGEIRAIAHEIMMLSGYNQDSVKKLEKNSQSVQA